MEKQLEILFIEDEISDADLMVRELRRAGIACNWTRVDGERDLRAALQRTTPDIVLSDFTLPAGFGGMAALKIVREALPDTPFVFVSGTIGEERAIETIRSGATDYVLKGNMSRLGMAVRRALQESEQRDKRRSAERALRDTKERLDSILRSLSDVVWSATGDRTQLLYVNACVEDVYARKPSEFHSNPELFFESIHPHDRERVNMHWMAALQHGHFDLEYRIVRPDGTQRWVHHRGWPVRGGSGEVRRVDGIVRDVTDRRRDEAQIEYLATHDGLTDLPNRNLLSDRLGQIIARAARTDSRFAVLFLDLDRFKLINDSYGHLIGDRVLQAVASRLRAILRNGDTVARLGGDEFVVVLIDIGDPSEVAALANRLLDEAFSVPFLVDSLKHSVQASVGVSVYPDDGASAELLLRNADAAMYRAKERGRDCVCFYAREMVAQVRERVELENALRVALEHQQLELMYQPQKDLASGRIYGVEALVRWRHPKLGLVMPGRFIPLAEETGLILALDEWVLRTACRQAQRWSSVLPLSVAVNISARQFQQPNLREAVERVLRETGLAAERLDIELTETMLLHSTEPVTRNLHQLKSLGVKLSLDDFGTGYSSLLHIKYFPIDAIKIDQSFIRDLSSDVEDSSIVKAIIAMASSLGIRTVAEGVETRAQLDFLKSQGCDAVQGHCLSPALSAESFTALLESSPVA